MNRNQILSHLRLEMLTGRHLNTCFIEPTKRAEGWERIQRARRIARRLNLDNRCLPQL